ncbi:MAG: hypothetical protein NNA21_09320 [Nitrospira sp.]|nr:hypothetical protein [Nitrospira sp.]MCP9462790.1 hypothetical protein [Nitrospira sp.]MCP9475831.1 hypothetical protein [Nitrospira sp.]
MTAADSPYRERLRQLADLMLAVAGESVTMMKKTAPEQALTLKRQNEWGLYLEFLKILFNLADRLAALHIPIKDQMDFMNSLEDAVTGRLKDVLAPAFGDRTDQMEIALTIGTTVAESRRTYEPYAFLITEESKIKNDMFRDFGEKIADAFGAPGNAKLGSAAALCAGAVVPAMEAILRGQAQPTSSPPAAEPSEQPMVRQDRPDQSDRQRATGRDIKLISMVSSISRDVVETRWGLHPRFREDLTPDELRQLTTLLNRVAKIVGERCAAVACSEQWASTQRAGHA